MKDVLIFLGSGGSVQFGLLPVKQFASEFEKHLQQRSEHDSSHDMNPMLSLYEDIKSTLIRVHGYTDLESVFSVENFLESDRTVIEYDMATAS